MRVLTVLGAYVAAAFVGASVASIGVIANDAGFSPYLVFGWFVAFVWGCIGTAPLALPLILLTEIRKSASWWMFLMAGLAAGFAVAILLAWPPSFRDMPFVMIAAASAAAGAMTYWLIAWRIRPPKAPSDSGQ